KTQGSQEKVTVDGLTGQATINLYGDTGNVEVKNAAGSVTVKGNAPGSMLTVDRSTDPVSESGQVTNLTNVAPDHLSTLTGLGLAPISFNGLASLNVKLGLGANSYTVNYTNANPIGATTTTIVGGPGSDAFTVLGAPWPTVKIDGNDGND